jgi:hypothetical protein
LALPVVKHDRKSDGINANAEATEPIAPGALLKIQLWFGQYSLQ